MKTAKSALADGMQNARALASYVISTARLSKRHRVQPSFEKATAYAKQVYDVAAGTHAEVSKLVEEQVTEFNKQVISALDQLVEVGSRRAPKSASRP